jgi:hypothetical protein
MIFEPLGFITRLTALASKPRVKLTRYYGLFSPIMLLIRVAAD